MFKKAPGKSHRKGISLVEIMRKFPNDMTAEAWFVQRRWPDGVHCPHCGSTNVQTGVKHKTMPFRCREKECAKRFSTKTGTVMEDSKLGFQVWMIATYLLSTSLKSVSSMKLHRDLNINQRSAWFLAHCFRAVLAEKGGVFDGPVEVDETCFGGRRKNMSNAKRKDVARGYEGMPFNHETVTHSLFEYDRGDVNTNGIESLWSTMKRAHKGIFHKMSPKHLDRYVGEFPARHNLREADTIDIMGAIADGGVGKRLRYRELIAVNGLASGTRSP